MIAFLTFLMTYDPTVADTVRDRAEKHQVFLTERQVVNITSAICRHSEDWDIEPARIMAVIENESRWIPDAVGGKDRGLMQIREITVKEVVRKTDLEHPQNLSSIESNVLFGTAYLSLLKGRFKVWPLIWTAYNRGPTAVRKDRRPNNYSRRVRKRYLAIKSSLRRHRLKVLKALSKK